MNELPPPPVTVAIPAHNAERYLAEAVASVQAQTYPGDVTIHILDDGSTDATLAVARKLAAADPAIKVTTQANQGRAFTRDRLLRQCDQALIAWIDADDLATPTWLDDQVGYLRQHPQCVAVSGQGYAMTAQRRALASLPPHPTDHASIVARHLYGHANAFYQSCTVVRAAEAVAAGGYRGEYFASEDFDLWLRLGERGELHNVDQIHLCYRVHDASANWTLSQQQRQQGFELTNAARQRAGLPPLPQPPHPSPAPRRDDWNRRVFWINRALQEGNAWTALLATGRALQRHPASLIFWLFGAVALADLPFCRGNVVGRLRPGHAVHCQHANPGPAYRWAIALNRIRRRLGARRSPADAGERSPGSVPPTVPQQEDQGQRQASEHGEPGDNR